MITPTKARVIDADRQCTEFLITHEGEEYRWHGNTPRFDVKEDLQKWLDTNEERILCDLHRKLYPEAKVDPRVDETPLQAWQRWIKDGEQNDLVVYAEDHETFVRRYQTENTTLTQVNKAIAIEPTEVTIDDLGVSKITAFVLKPGYIKKDGKFWRQDMPTRDEALPLYETLANQTPLRVKVDRRSFRHTWGNEAPQEIIY
jgi:hypothetical protein